MLGNITNTATGASSHLPPAPLVALDGQMLALGKTPSGHFLSSPSRFQQNTKMMSSVTPFDQLNFVDLKMDAGRFKCPICCLLCRDKCVLRNHYRVHSGEKPFACPFCPYKANQKSSLKTHILLQHKSLMSE